MPTKKELEANLWTMRDKLCVYSGERCDCKFGGSNPGRSESGSGCPEIWVFQNLLARMTQREFDGIMKRKPKHKIRIRPTRTPSPVKDFLKKAKPSANSLAFEQANDHC